MSSKSKNGTVNYKWGCITTKNDSCVESMSQTDDGDFVKLCTCCGDQCNGQQMDKITVDDGSCDHKMGPTTVTTTENTQTTTQTIPSTTTTPAAGQSTTVKMNTFSHSTMVIALASALVVGLIIIAVLSYQIHKTRQIIAIDTQDMAPIFVNEN